MCFGAVTCPVVVLWLHSLLLMEYFYCDLYVSFVSCDKMKPIAHPPGGGKLIY